GLAQEPGPQQVKARGFRRRQEAGRLAFGPLCRGIRRVAIRLSAAGFPAGDQAVDDGDDESADCERKQDSGGHGPGKFKAFCKSGATIGARRTGTMVVMDTSTIRALRAVALFAACGSCAWAAHAADPPLSVGALYGYGDGTNIYGVQIAWAPARNNEILEPYGLGLRLTGQLARWVARDSEAQYHSLTDANLMAELRYWLTSPGTVRPFVEAGFGMDLLSH